MLRFIGLVALTLFLGACTSEKVALSPEERREQEQRMRDFLNDSSPRNMNQQSKVTPEFTKQFRLPSPKKENADEATSEPTKQSNSDLDLNRD